MKKKNDGAKSPKESITIMTEMVLPQHTNALGGIFGGVVMSWIDIAAAIAARRHSGKVCVTASIDELHFLKPIKKGYIVNISAKVAAVHNTSCDVCVSVDAENPNLGESYHTATAYLTFVAVDDMGKPTPIPPLKVETPEEKQLQKEALMRRESHKELRKRLGKK